VLEGIFISCGGYVIRRFFCICNPPIVPELIMTRQLMATLYFDWGGFGFSNLVDVAEETKPYRLSIGLKMNLK